jgi:hypothetical protein
MMMTETAKRSGEITNTAAEAAAMMNAMMTLNGVGARAFFQSNAILTHHYICAKSTT